MLDRILERRLDTFLKKGLELSKNLSQNDREKVILKVFDEIVEQAIKNAKQSDIELSEEELMDVREDIYKKFNKFIKEKFKKY